LIYPTLQIMRASSTQFVDSFILLLLFVGMMLVGVHQTMALSVVDNHNNKQGVLLSRRLWLGTRLIPSILGISHTLSHSPQPAHAQLELAQVQVQVVPDEPKKLIFRTLDSGVQVADIVQGQQQQPQEDTDTTTTVVGPSSKINLHILGRLLGKQGWSFENSKASGEDPYRLQLGSGTVVIGLEEGLQGMKVGGRRRIVVPSLVGYTSKSLEPIPREFANRQRLYTTVMNSNRIDRERQNLGADLAGVVVFDIELVRIQK
jgi:FKBP-type peptidyl-prolyl cis-trans isomerase